MKSELSFLVCTYNRGIYIILQSAKRTSLDELCSNTCRFILSIIYMIIFWFITHFQLALSDNNSHHNGNQTWSSVILPQVQQQITKLNLCICIINANVPCKKGRVDREVHIFICTCIIYFKLEKQTLKYVRLARQFISTWILCLIYVSK